MELTEDQKRELRDEIALALRDGFATEGKYFVFRKEGNPINRHFEINKVLALALSEPAPAQLTPLQEAAVELGRVAASEAGPLEQYCFSMVNDAGVAWNCSAKLNEAICDYQDAAAETETQQPDKRKGERRVGEPWASRCRRDPFKRNERRAVVKEATPEPEPAAPQTEHDAVRQAKVLAVGEHLISTVANMFSCDRITLLDSAPALQLAKEVVLADEWAKRLTKSSEAEPATPATPETEMDSTDRRQLFLDCCAAPFGFRFLAKGGSALEFRYSDHPSSRLRGEFTFDEIVSWIKATPAEPTEAEADPFACEMPKDITDRALDLSIQEFGSGDDEVFCTANFQQAMQSLGGLKLSGREVEEILSADPRIVQLKSGTVWLRLPRRHRRFVHSEISEPTVALNPETAAQFEAEAELQRAEHELAVVADKYVTSFQECAFTRGTFADLIEKVEAVRALRPAPAPTPSPADLISAVVTETANSAADNAGIDTFDIENRKLIENIVRDGIERAVAISERDGQLIADCYWVNAGDNAARVARRIAAALNATAGIELEELERPDFLADLCRKQREACAANFRRLDGNEDISREDVLRAIGYTPDATEPKS